MCVFTYVWVHVLHVCGAGQVDTGYLPQLLSTLRTEGGPLVHLAHRASQLVRGSCIGIIDGS